MVSNEIYIVVIVVLMASLYLLYHCMNRKAPATKAVQLVLVTDMIEPHHFDAMNAEMINNKTHKIKKNCTVIIGPYRANQNKLLREQIVSCKSNIGVNLFDVVSLDSIESVQVIREHIHLTLNARILQSEFDTFVQDFGQKNHHLFEALVQALRTFVDIRKSQIKKAKLLMDSSIVEADFEPEQMPQNMVVIQSVDTPAVETVVAVPPITPPTPVVQTQTEQIVPARDISEVDLSVIVPEVELVPAQFVYGADQKRRLFKRKSNIEPSFYPPQSNEDSQKGESLRIPTESITHRMGGW